MEKKIKTKMKHSNPILYIFIILETLTMLAGSILIGVISGFIAGILVFVFFYLFVGLCIWFIGGLEPNFLKALFLWYPAILFDKMELTA